jgi:hypothetical protein
MGSLGLTCDQVKINFPVGSCRIGYPLFCVEAAAKEKNEKTSTIAPPLKYVLCRFYSPICLAAAPFCKCKLNLLHHHLKDKLLISDKVARQRRKWFLLGLVHLVLFVHVKVLVQVLQSIQEEEAERPSKG